MLMGVFSDSKSLHFSSLVEVDCLGILLAEVVSTAGVPLWLDIPVGAIEVT